MSRYQRKFTLTKQKIAYLRSRGYSLLCRKCEEELLEGQEIRSLKRPKGAVHYHETCWEGTRVA